MLDSMYVVEGSSYVHIYVYRISLEKVKRTQVKKLVLQLCQVFVVTSLIDLSSDKKECMSIVNGP